MELFLSLVFMEWSVFLSSKYKNMKAYFIFNLMQSQKHHKILLKSKFFH